MKTPLSELNEAMPFFRGLFFGLLALVGVSVPVGLLIAWACSR